MSTEVAKIILFDRNHQILIYLRDDKPTIPYPNHWDLLGGLVDEGETPELAIVREVEEEIGINISKPKPFGKYLSEEGFDFYTFWARISKTPDELTLTEGQCLTSIDLEERDNFKFVPILKKALSEFAKNE